MRRIAVLTSGGDAPGMNAAIRSVVRTALGQGIEVFGVRNGYAGLVAGAFHFLGARDVGGIIGRGGTILGSARCPEFKTEDGLTRAVREVSRQNIDGLVVIGGNGSQTGSYDLSRRGVAVVGVGSTIDNDLYGAEPSLGVDTALNVALESIDRLKTTASSHQRAFLVEVMGRDCGYLALMAALAGGAEAVAIPEFPTDPETLGKEIRSSYERGKSHAIIVVAEGATMDAEELAQYFDKHRERMGFGLRVTKIGHVQRGGEPSGFDRILGTRLGAAAVKELAEGRAGVVIGQMDGKIVSTPLAESVAKKKVLDHSLVELSQVLAR